MNFVDYARLGDINWSTLKHMRRSPLHFKHARDMPPEDTTRLARGRASHTAVFEPDRFLIEYALFKGARRAGRAWETFKEQHPDETILKIDEYQKALALRDAVRSNALAMRYLAKGRAEETIQWTDHVTGLGCKGRIDWVSSSSPAIVDLKTTGDVSTLRFGAVAARLAYHAQLAFYREGYFRAHGVQLPVVILAVELEAPHDVVVYRVEDDEIYAGEKEFAELLAEVRKCTETNSWPGRYATEQKLHLPGWAFRSTGEDSVDGLDLLITGQETTQEDTVDG